MFLFLLDNRLHCDCRVKLPQINALMDWCLTTIHCQLTSSKSVVRQRLIGVFVTTRIDSTRYAAAALLRVSPVFANESR